MKIEVKYGNGSTEVCDTECTTLDGFAMEKWGRDSMDIVNGEYGVEVSVVDEPRAEQGGTRDYIALNDSASVEHIAGPQGGAQGPGAVADAAEGSQKAPAPAAPAAKLSKTRK